MQRKIGCGHAHAVYRDESLRNIGRSRFNKKPSSKAARQETEQNQTIRLISGGFFCFLRG
jgi:hypothetical protein